MDREYTLITGASGFIGSHVAERLSSDNRYAIVAIVREGSNQTTVNALKEKGVVFFGGSFFDEMILDHVFGKYDIKNIIHIAAVRGSGHGSKEDYHKVNVLGTDILLQYALKNRVNKFIFCSSVGVFGTIPCELPASLNTPLKGDNYYHSSKILAEEKVREFIDKGLNAFIVRPTIVYGRGDSGFPSTFVSLVRRRMLLLPFSENRIHLLDVDKLADIFIRLLCAENHEGRIFIAADSAAISCRELADTIYSHFFGRPYPAFLSLPDFAYKIMGALFSFIRNDKWLLRILLISRSWYFESSDTYTKLALAPSITKDGFKGYLEQLNHS